MTYHVFATPRSRSETLRDRFLLGILGLLSTLCMCKSLMCFV